MDRYNNIPVYTCILVCINVGALKPVKPPCFVLKVSISYHFVLVENVNKGLKIEHVFAEYMIADILTKRIVCLRAPALYRKVTCFRIIHVSREVLNVLV